MSEYITIENIEKLTERFPEIQSDDWKYIKKVPRDFNQVEYEIIRQALLEAFEKRK